MGVSIDSEDNQSRMMGDSASVIFAAPEEINKLIEARADGIRPHSRPGVGFVRR